MDAALFSPPEFMGVSSPTTRSPRTIGIDAALFTPAYNTTQRYAASDWAKNLRTLPRSMILKRIRSPLTSRGSLSSKPPAPAPQPEPAASSEGDEYSDDAEEEEELYSEDEG